MRTESRAYLSLRCQLLRHSSAMTQDRVREHFRALGDVRQLDVLVLRMGDPERTRPVYHGGDAKLIVVVPRVA